MGDQSSFGHPDAEMWNVWEKPNGAALFSLHSFSSFSSVFQQDLLSSTHDNTTQADPQLSADGCWLVLFVKYSSTPNIRELEMFLLNCLFQFFLFLFLSHSINLMFLSAAPLACFSWDKCTDFKQQHWSYFNDFDLCFALLLPLLMSSFDLCFGLSSGNHTELCEH